MNMATATEIVSMHVEEQAFPRYDHAHGTPDPMIRRTLVLRLGKCTAQFEQTDYGHPGRWNAWEPRGLESALQARTPELLALCAALTPLLR